MSFQLVVAIPTFVCSLLSLLANTTFAIFYGLFPPERHFRQALIVNLLVANWISSLNNTISGATALSRRHACTANGYIGQFSVQAVDFNILIISLAVLLTVRASKLTIEPTWWQVAVVCTIPWIAPLITANVALGLKIYSLVSGNWCWIERSLLLRYSLTHGWRIAIFFITIAIYTYVYIYLNRVYGKVHVGAGSTVGTCHDTSEESRVQQDRKPFGAKTTISAWTDSDDQLLRPLQSKSGSNDARAVS